MCMRMKMIVCISVNQHVLGSITSEMSERDRYYPFISVLIEFFLNFGFKYIYIYILIVPTIKVVKIGILRRIMGGRWDRKS